MKDAAKSVVWEVIAAEAADFKAAPWQRKLPEIVKRASTLDAIADSHKATQRALKALQRQASQHKPLHFESPKFVPRQFEDEHGLAIDNFKSRFLANLLASLTALALTSKEMEASFREEMPNWSVDRRLEADLRSWVKLWFKGGEEPMAMEQKRPEAAKEKDTEHTFSSSMESSAARYTEQTATALRFLALASDKSCKEELRTVLKRYGPAYGFHKPDDLLDVFGRGRWNMAAIELDGDSDDDLEEKGKDEDEKDKVKEVEAERADAETDKETDGEETDEEETDGEETDEEEADEGETGEGETDDKEKGGELKDREMLLMVNSIAQKLNMTRARVLLMAVKTFNTTRARAIARIFEMEGIGRSGDRGDELDKMGHV